MSFREDDKKFMAEILQKNQKPGVFENISLSNIFQVLIVAGIIGFYTKFEGAKENDIIQQQFNQQQSKDMQELKNDFKDLSIQFAKFSQAERYTQNNADTDLMPIKSKLQYYEEEFNKRELWMRERDEFESKVNLDIEMLKQKINN